MKGPSENANKGPQIFYVRDGFGKESWHYAVSEEAGIRAHKFHFFGNEGLSKQYKESPKASLATSFFGKVCLDAQCVSLAGVPFQVASQAEKSRIV